MGIIRARISDELESKVKGVIAEQEANMMGGEINISTVIRYALEQFIKEYEEKKDGIVTLKFDVKNMTENELDSVAECSKILSKAFNQYEALEEGTYDQIPLNYRYGRLSVDVAKEYLKRFRK